MSSIYYPARGFRVFKGKASQYLKILVVVAAIIYPISIQADTLPAPIAAPATETVMSANGQTPLLAVAPAQTTQTVWVTAYTSDPDQTSNHPLITASGDMVRDGIVADNLLPFGTRIEIPALFGNKVFTVEDRTNQKFSGRVDIWMPNDAQAVNFGIERAQIVVLNSNLAMQ